MPACSRSDAVPPVAAEPLTVFHGSFGRNDTVATALEEQLSPAEVHHLVELRSALRGPGRYLGTARLVDLGDAHDEVEPLGRHCQHLAVLFDRGFGLILMAV